MSSEQLMMFAVLGAYALAAVGAQWALAAPTGRRRAVSLALTALGLLTHTIALVRLTFRVGRLPMGNSYEVLSLFLWLVAASYLAVELWRPVRGLGLLCLPLLTVLAAVTAAFAGQWSPDERARSVLLVLHGGSALLGFAAFALAAAAAALFLVQDKALKRHGAGRLWPLLPAVDQLERLACGSVSFGFVLLTLSLALGIYLARRRPGWATQHTVLLSLLTWLLFAVLFHVRLTSAWRGRRTAYLTIAGFALVAAVFVVLLVTSDTLHRLFA